MSQVAKEKSKAQKAHDDAKEDCLRKRKNLDEALGTVMAKAVVGQVRAFKDACIALARTEKNVNEKAMAHIAMRESGIEGKISDAVYDDVMGHLEDSGYLDTKFIINVLARDLLKIAEDAKSAVRDEVIKEMSSEDNVTGLKFVTSADLDKAEKELVLSLKDGGRERERGFFGHHPFATIMIETTSGVIKGLKDIVELRQMLVDVSKAAAKKAKKRTKKG